MNLENKRILILGGSGLVGQAVARRLLSFRPAKLTLVALTEDEVTAAAEALRPHAGTTAIDVDWGNVFLPIDASRVKHAAMLADDPLRARVVDDTFGELDQGVLDRSFLYRLLTRVRPHAVVDCINTATAFAYQNVFASARRLRNRADTAVSPAALDAHLLSIPLPQLIRHVQVLVEGLRAADTEAYAKIGTSGTGGMGLNVPYTHSEERPSRTLLAKSAVAGAHSLLLFLVARTPGAPAVIEVKPTAAIAWRDIAFGPVRRRGRPIALHDCPKPVPVAEAFGEHAAGWSDTGRVLQSVFADVGENGLFAREEFEAVTTLGQMEFVTPEEVAEAVVMELCGRPTGRDVVSALDGATFGPTYRAGVLRSAALERLTALEQEHGVRSIAFEMLGPPRLSKLLYESHLLSRICPSVRELGCARADALARQLDALLQKDAGLRQTIISVGLPIILANGKVYRAAEVIVPPIGGDVERAAARGWVDLRPQNCGTWIGRAGRMVEQAAARANEGTGSSAEWSAISPEGPISPARFATWIFRHEDDGERIKR